MDVANGSSSDVESEDEIVARIPVFLTKQAQPSQEMHYLLSYPLRQASRPVDIDVGQLKDVKIRPIQQAIEHTYSRTIHADHENHIAEVTVRTRTSGFMCVISTFIHVNRSHTYTHVLTHIHTQHKIDEYVLKGKRVNVNANHCIGRIAHGAVHLTPIHRYECAYVQVCACVCVRVKVSHIIIGFCTHTLPPSSACAA
jgi:hypothetical protein